MSAKIFDVSMPIYPEMTVYKNKAEKRPKLTITADHPSRNLRETQITMNMHTGTHIDAPLHMVKDGATMDEYSVEQFVRRCQVVDLTEVSGAISKADLLRVQITPGYFVFLKTTNSFTDRWESDFSYLSAEAAGWLADSGVAGVGIDALGIERGQPNHETHKVLFAHRIVIIEGLRLREVPAGEYLMVALPLAIAGVEAAPARVILLDDGCGVV